MVKKKNLNDRVLVGWNCLKIRNVNILGFKVDMKAVIRIKYSQAKAKWKHVSGKEGNSGTDF